MGRIVMRIQKNMQTLQVHNKIKGLGNIMNIVGILGQNYKIVIK